MKIAVIGDEVFVSVWRLIGADGYVIDPESEPDLLKRLGNLLKGGEYSAIILPEKFVDRVNKLIEEESLGEKLSPLLVFVPEPGSRKRLEDLRRKISTALGVEIEI